VLDIKCRAKPPPVIGLYNIGSFSVAPATGLMFLRVLF